MVKNVQTLWDSSRATTLPIAESCSRKIPRQMLNSEHAVSGEMHGQERSTIVRRRAYILLA